MNTIKSALLLARLSEGGDGENGEVFVIGGGEIFTEFLPIAEKLYITRIDEVFEGDTVFPEIGEDMWVLISEEPGSVDDGNPYDHSFQIYVRRAD